MESKAASPRKTPQGQWLNNQEVAEYLNKYGVIEYSQLPQEISIPEGLGQVSLCFI